MFLNTSTSQVEADHMAEAGVGLGFKGDAAEIRYSGN